MSIGTLATAGVAICQVNDLLPDDAHFLDNDDEKPKLRLSDDQVWQQIIKIAGVTSSRDFPSLQLAAVNSLRIS